MSGIFLNFVRSLPGWSYFGDSGDEYENMAGRVIQFTRDRVEKELDNLSLGYRGSGTLQYDYRHVYCQF